MREILKRSPFLRDVGRLLRSRLLVGDHGWKSIDLESPSHLSGEEAQRRILVATSFGGEVAMTSVESLIAGALKLRGSSVDALLCDGIGACQLCDTTRFSSTEKFVGQGLPKFVCRGCFSSGVNVYSSMGIRVHRMLASLEEEDRIWIDTIVNNVPFNDIPDFKLDGVNIGEHTVAGACRYYAKADISDEPLNEPLVRKYFRAALVTFKAVRKLLEKYQYECVVLNHGIYIPQGIIAEVSRSMGIRVVTWNTAYRKQCFIFSHNDTYHHEFMYEDNAVWSDRVMKPAERQRTLDYLYSRSVGTHDWIAFNNTPFGNSGLTASAMGARDDQTVISLFTNVLWDAQLHYPANVFDNMLEWLLETIRYFQERDDLFLIVRVHPAEMTGNLPSRQLVSDVVRDAFGSELRNVRIVGSDDPQNSYEIASISNAAIIYGSKIGVELSAVGLPVIVAGEAWLRNKGIGIDVSNRKDYFDVLNSLPFSGRLEDDRRERAIKYAHHFFFRRMIPLKSIVPTGGIPKFRLDINNRADLLPGACNGLDVVCDGIVFGEPFTFDGVPDYD